MKKFIKRNFLVLAPSAINKFERLAAPDADCIGTVLQNQHKKANFWVCNHEPMRTEEAQLIKPGLGLLEDLLSGQEEVWVMTDIAGALLTYTKKYANEVF